MASETVYDFRVRASMYSPFFNTVRVILTAWGKLDRVTGVPAARRSVNITLLTRVRLIYDVPCMHDANFVALVGKRDHVNLRGCLVNQCNYPFTPSKPLAPIGNYVVYALPLISYSPFVDHSDVCTYVVAVQLKGPATQLINQTA